MVRGSSVGLHMNDQLMSIPEVRLVERIATVLKLTRRLHLL